jgi:hypothetical protein
MNRIAMLTTTLVAALGAIPAPMPAEAADEATVVRCVSPDGTIGYTDRSCAVFGAQAVPMDPELAARLSADRARAVEAAYASRFSGDAYGGGSDDPLRDGAYPPPSDAGDGFDAATASLVNTVPGRRSPASGCARSPAQLANDLEASVALGDVNRIAESYHFAGMSTAAGERVLDRLQRYAGRVVLDSRYIGGIRTVRTADASLLDEATGSIGAASTGAYATASSGPAMVRLVLAGDDGAATSLDFDVERYAGCYFVSFA